MRVLTVAAPDDTTIRSVSINELKTLVKALVILSYYAHGAEHRIDYNKIKEVDALAKAAIPIMDNLELDTDLYEAAVKEVVEEGYMDDSWEGYHSMLKGVYALQGELNRIAIRARYCLRCLMTLASAVMVAKRPLLVLTSE